MKRRDKNHRDGQRKRSGKPPRWLVFGTLAATTAFGGRVTATKAYAQENEGQLPGDRVPTDRRAGSPRGTRSLVSMLNASWPETAVTAATIADGAYARGKGQTQDLPTRSFAIPPGPLAAALKAFEETAGVAVRVTHEAIGSLESPGVSGLLKVDQALERLLAGTGVTYLFTDPQAVTLDLEMLTETLDVTAPSAPSSPKYTEPLRDTPQTMTVISRELIQEQGATTLREALRNVTGISIQAGEGGGGLPGDNLSIRGFAARNDIFVDGVRDFGAYTRDPFNVEQIEVTKGPASLYAGRGSTGGSLNLASKSPGLAAFQGATLGVGLDNFSRATIDVNQPIADIDGAAFRVNAMWNQGDTPGRDEVESKRWGVAPSLAFGLGTPTRVTLSYSHLAQDNVPEYGLPWVPPTNVPLAEYADQPAPVDFDNFYGLTDRDYEETVTGVATAKIEHDLNDAFTLRGLLRHGRAERDSIITAPRFVGNDSTQLNRQLQARDLTDTILAQQTDLTGTFKTGNVEHATITGFEVAREGSKNYARTGPTAPVADLFNPDPGQPYLGPITRTGAFTESEAETVALYASDTVKLNEKWQVIGGLRWDRFNIDFDSVATTGEVTPFERTDEMLSWRAGVVNKPLPNGSIYASYGTSFNPSADGNTGLSLTTALVDLEPEKSRGYELGTKWDLLGNRLALSAAVFRTEKTNARTPGVDPGDPPTVLEGEQRVDGVEIGVNGSFTSRWSAFFGFTHLESEILKSNTPAEVGKELPNTPENSVSLWTTYRLRRGLEVGAGAQFVDDRFNNATNVRTAPDYLLFDAMASYRLNERFNLRLNVTNLTDERYIDRVGGGHFIPGTGRAVSLSTDIDF